MKRFLLFAAIGALLSLVVSCQKTPTAELSVSQNEYTVQASGGSVNVSVSSNVDLTVRISAGWITQAGGPSSGGGTYSFTIAHNDGYDARTATITFSNGEQGVSETVTITQAQQDAIISGSLEYKLFYEAQTFSLPVSTNVDCSVSVTGGDWIKSLGTRGLTTKQYQFSIAENTGKTPREAVVTITSGSLKQSIKVEQLPTTHRPVTKEEWKSSFKETETITKTKFEVLSQLKKSGITDVGKITQELLKIDGVIDAIPNRNKTVISVMQKDSIWLDLFLYNPNSKSTFNSSNTNKKYSSSLATRTTSSSNGAGSAKRKALILAPFQRDFNEPLTEDYKQEEWDLTWSDMLEPYFVVEPLLDSQADIYHFTGKELSDDYDFVLISTHGDEVILVENRIIGGRKETPVNVLLSGTKYSEDIITDLLESGYTYYTRLGSPAESDDSYLEMNPSFLDEASFNETVVILSACSSANPSAMADAFRAKGASYVIGTECPMDNTAQIVFNQNLLSCLSNGMTFKDAYHYSAKSEIAKQWAQRTKDIFGKVPGFTEADMAAIDIFNSISVIPKKFEFDYYFSSPYPSIVVEKSKGDVLVWECNLKPFTVNSAVVEDAQLYDFGDGVLQLGSDWNHDISYKYSIKYSIYIDKKNLGETTNKSYVLTGIPVGKHKAYVVANIVAGEGNNILYSYKSKEEEIEVTGKAVAVTGIRLTPSTITLEEGQSSQLTATVYPANATNKKVIWSSNYPESVSVDENGLITAINRRLGVTIIITAKTEDGEKTATCRVYVNESTAGKVAVTGISLGQSSAEIKMGDVLQLNATVAPSNATNKTVTWSSSNNSVATVSSSGLVSAKAEGTAKITAKTEDGGKTATVTITVKKADGGSVSVTGVSLDKSSISLKVGESETLKATVSPANATNKGLTWTSSMSSVATVTSDGVVTAKAAGTATITVKTDDGGKTATCNVTVTYNGDPGGEISVSQVTISPTTANMTVGDTKQFSVKIDPANATNQEVSWSSSEPSVASVDSKGMVTAKAEGKATITVTAKDGGVSSKATVTVSNKVVPVTGVTVSPTSLTMEIGDSKSLTVTVNPSDATDKTYTVSSDNTGVVEIDKSNNVVAKGAGTANVTVTTTDGAQTATCKVTVNKPLMTIEASPTSLSFGEVNVGENSTKTFTISNTGKAEVKVSGISVPTAFGTDASTPFTIAVGQSKTVTVTFTPTDGKDYSGTITITSDADSQPTVALSGTGVKQTSSETLKAVDLGLSVKWANMDLGASSSSEKGDSYLWGTTDPTLTTDPYFPNYDIGITKYSYCVERFGIPDYRNRLEGMDDAAHVKLGGNWRLPTMEEAKELFDKCSLTFEGSACVITGPNGNSITVPAEIEYWTSIFRGEVDVYVFGIYKRNSYCTSVARGEKLPIRPVYGDRPDWEPKLSVSRSSFDFGTVTVGQTSTIDFVMKNVGDTKLFLYGVDIPTDFQFKINSYDGTPYSGTDFYALEIEPGCSFYSSLAFGPMHENYDGLSISFYTNSVSDPVLTIPIKCKAKQDPRMELIDFGYSVGWGANNLGASSPEGTGDFYAWAEIEPKSEYSWSTYKYYDLEKDETTKYNNDNNNSIREYLEYEDDVARQKLGGRWRLPSLDESYFFGYASADCKITKYVEYNGVNCTKVTHETGLVAYFPYVGYMTPDGIKASNDCLYMLNSASSSKKCALGYPSNGTSNYRCYGYQVRPVCARLKDEQGLLSFFYMNRYVFGE